jgi:hypothetical protein
MLNKGASASEPHGELHGAWAHTDPNPITISSSVRARMGRSPVASSGSVCAGTYSDRMPDRMSEYMPERMRE